MKRTSDILLPTQLSTSYLGQYGYTVMKSDFSPEQDTELRKQLTVIPQLNGGGGGGGGGQVASVSPYPIYRESQDKYFLPRFWAERQFGFPQGYLVKQGVDIHVPFAGSLRPKQLPVVEAFVAAKTQRESIHMDHGLGGLLELPCAYGKTVLTLYILAEVLKQKTVVCVNSGFLMKQWIDRIGQFLPTARVGRIQQKIFDVENKDIVLCSIQTLHRNSDNPQLIQRLRMAGFGCTVVDEVHHISSRMFSKILFQLVTKYMIGLSATMDRSDGTTYAFKYFLGDVLFKGERDLTYNVLVRCIQYEPPEEHRNMYYEELHDVRGKFAFTSMVSKITSFEPRTEFAAKIILDLFAEQPEGQQIMVLSHRRSHLEAIEQCLQTAAAAAAAAAASNSGHKEYTRGYFVGGMEDDELDESASADIVLATFQMASEALDISTLTTLVMVTPKKDVEQSVGRVLRAKHKQIIVVDLYDRHSTFLRQSKTRQSFYRECEFSLAHCKKHDYTDMTRTSWRVETTTACNSNDSTLGKKRKWG